MRLASWFRTLKKTDMYKLDAKFLLIMYSAREEQIVCSTVRNRIRAILFCQVCSVIQRQKRIHCATVQICIQTNRNEKVWAAADLNSSKQSHCVTVGRVNTARLLDMCGNHG
jgi:hypothetical protein